MDIIIPSKNGDKKSNRIVIVGVLLAVSTILIVGLCVRSCVKNNQFCEMKLYGLNIRITADTYLLLTIAGGVSDAWNSGIDIGVAGGYGTFFAKHEIEKWFDSVKDQIEDLKNSNKQIGEDLKRLKERPTQYKDAYNALVEVYSVYSQIYVLVLNPSGSLVSFNAKIGDLKSEFDNKSSKLKLLLPQQISGIDGREKEAEKNKNKERPKIVDEIVTANYVNRGNTLADEGKFDEAITYYNKAIDTNAKLVEAYYNRSIAYSKKGDDDQAISDLNKTIELNPNHDKAYYNRGLLYIVKRNYDQAVADYNKAVALGHKADSYFLDLIKKMSDSVKSEGNEEEVKKNQSEIQKVSIILEGIMFDAKGKSSVLINGNTFSEGDMVRGIKINKINEDYVDVEINGQKKQIRVGSFTFTK